MADGFSGDSLALFTALSPSAAVAFACLAFFLFFHKGDERFVERVNRLLAVPLALCWLGFMAAATHLGTPANALHAISGVGRSPLSNEVVAAVAFLFFAGVYWLYMFKIKPVRAVSLALLAASVVSSVALVSFTAVAYSVPTVPSWDTWHSPVNLVLSALFAGPVVAAAVLRLCTFLESGDAASSGKTAASGCAASSDGTASSGEVFRTRRWNLGFAFVSFAALLIGTVMLFDHRAFLATVSNDVTSAAALVPDYAANIVIHCLIGVSAYLMQLAAARMDASSKTALALHAGASACALCAVYLIRLPFYASYLSVGF